MSTKKLSTLAIVACVMVATTIVLYLQPESGDDAFQRGTHLIQGLAPEAIQKIQITHGGSEVVLARDDNGFVLPAKSNYPASPRKINDLLVDLLDVQCAERITDSTSLHEKLGVAEGAPQAVGISFVGQDSDRLVGLVKGKRAEQGRGVYVRVMGDDVVYATEKPLSVQTAPLSYCEKSILDLAADKIQKVMVAARGDTYTLVKEGEDNPVLQNVPAGKQMLKEEVKSVFEALKSFEFKDVYPAGSQEVHWDGEYECSVSDELTYIVRTAEDEDTHYARVRAKGPDVEEVTVARSESRESLEAKDRVLQAADKAKAFNEEHGSWVYEIASLQAKKMRKPVSALLEDVSDEEAKTPDEIRARHILISYKDAERSEADRSKEEARRLADSVLQKAEAPDANFAQLARKYSDGPSAEKGGDLGSFGKGRMAPAFEKAAFALKVGDVSEVVETPFGFHIIKRTE